MRDRAIEAIVGRREQETVPLSSLMPRRVRDVLLVSSIYDSYTFEEDGQLNELLFSEYLALNLRYAPRIERVSTAAEALDLLGKEKFDLVISMLRVGGMDVIEFCESVNSMVRDLPVVLLAYNTRELPMLESMTELPAMDKVFVWHGDVRLFLAIIKSVEDRWNAWHDARVAGVQSIILIEDSPQFYSSYLPMLYTELVLQTQALLSDGINRTQQLMRMRARPKVLLATSYEEGLKLYKDYGDFVLGVIVDAECAREGCIDPDAGLDFVRMVKEHTPDKPVLVQSSEHKYRQAAESLGAHFINKNSPSLLQDVRDFMRSDLGFGAFVFRMPDGEFVGVASDLRGLIEALKEIPDESLIYHARRNDFSSWLRARTEFDLAKALRPRRVEEFEDVESIRQYLLDAVEKYRQMAQAGVVAEFSREIFHTGSKFVKIGTGSLGGKGRGLAFINSLLNKYKIAEHIEGIRITVPPTTVLTTDIFDQFMQSPGLIELVLKECGDENVIEAFGNASLPKYVVDSLRIFLEMVKYPLAVRSSSLLEDASSQPFAGIYRTYMIPNSDENIEVRLDELCTAIKMVYASIYCAESRSYIEMTPNRLEEEKMAVVIQQVVGRHHENYLYPDISGVARSYDYYPMEGTKAEDGIADVALGLGKIVVDGGKCVRFSPKHPQKLYQFSNPEDYLEHSQKQFYALDLNIPAPDWGVPDGSEANLALLNLKAAEEHGTLDSVGSVYSPENDAVYDGITRPGVRLVTMSGVLKSGVLPLGEALSFLLDVGSAGFSCPVEIEFAANLRRKPGEKHEFAFLQIRPLAFGFESKEFHLGEIERDHAICISHNALGHGFFDGIRDIVYIPRRSFTADRTVEMAQEIERLNNKLNADHRSYLLIGPGRWGTSDRFAGVPVTWSQISGVRLMVETDLKGTNAPPSQGTHFFHNITSLGVGYITLDSKATENFLDQAWLDDQPAVEEGQFTRHIAFDEPLNIVLDSRSRFGVIMKPGHRVPIN